MDGAGWLWVTLVLLLLLSAFFSSAETAFSSVNRLRLKALAQGGDARAGRALRITGDYDRALSTVLIGNNTVNIAASSIATLLATRLVGEQLAAAVSTLVLTAVVLVFGEVCPKSYAKANAEKVSLLIAGPMGVLMVFFSPLARLLVALTNLVRRASQEEAPTVTEQELKYLIDTTVEEGVLHEEESVLLRSAIDFDDIRVQEILTPRVDVAAVEVNEDIGEILDLIVAERYSRLPVYEGSIDKIIGVLYTRDFLEALATGKAPDVRGMLAQCLYVHKTMKIAALLGEFKRKKHNLAVVMDDYGGTMGVVTTEDILEELVGEIWDEDEEIVSEFTPLGEGRFEVAGDYPVRDLLEGLRLGEDAMETESTTAGGWALERLGRIPDPGDTFTDGRLRVTVKEIFEQRLVKLLVELAPPPAPDKALKKPH